MAIRSLSDTLSPADWLASWQQRQEQLARRRLLARVDTSLVWHDKQLINTASGESQVLEADSGTLAEQLAAAAARLLAGRRPAGILLLLPPSCCAATPFDFAIRGSSLLRSALQLQAPQLLPAFEEPLLLALDARRSKGIALWLPQSLADALHAAFKARNLPLVALQPRPLAAALTGPRIDVDADTHTLFDRDQGFLGSWLPVAKRDLEQADFARKWEEQLAASGAAHAALLDATYWRSLRQVVPPAPDYNFIPPATQLAGQLGARDRVRRRAGAALAAGVALLALPFLYNSLRLQWLEQALDEAMQASARARASQTAVVGMEDAWAPVLRHPQQDIRAVLQTLDRYIEGGLSSFSIDRGVVDISGYVPDPALLVEQLAGLEQFHRVVQSRSSSGGGDGDRGTRFGIRMQLTEVDFAAWDAVLSGQEALR